MQSTTLRLDHRQAQTLSPRLQHAVRLLQMSSVDFVQELHDLMTRNPVVVDGSMLAAEALNIMERRKITSLVVVAGPDKAVAGVVHLHDLWRTGLV